MWSSSAGTVGVLHDWHDNDLHCGTFAKHRRLTAYCPESGLLSSGQNTEKAGDLAGTSGTTI
jgi:hypothetical protein